MADADPKPSPVAGSEQRPASKQPWEQPRLTELPRLTDLTLLTGGGIGGGGGGSSTVF